MISKKTTFLLTSIALTITLYSSCKNERKDCLTEDATKTTMSTKKNSNPVVYFEIPVTNMDKAVKFYSAVFNFDFEKDIIDHNEMALFPFTVTDSGISGALAKGEIYKPTIDGCRSINNLLIRKICPVVKKKRSILHEVLFLCKKNENGKHTTTNLS